MSVDRPMDDRRHIITELGLTIRRAGEGLHGSAPVVPEMYVPGTTAVRASVLAAWADVLSGLLSSQALAPRVPVTLELAIDLFHEASGGGRIDAMGRILKAGKAVVVAEVEFSTARGEPLAIGTASFMAAPDVTLTMPDLTANLSRHHASPSRLTMPFAERAGCRRTGPGVATLARSEDGLNASNTINGGLVALAVEEAALSLRPGATLASLAMRYLRPARIGPVKATATQYGDLARVSVHDTGNGNRLTVSATTRIFPPASPEV